MAIDLTASQDPLNKSETQIALMAPGYGELDFKPAAAGTYELAILGDARNAKVLNTEGEVVEFHQLFKGKYTLLSFMYTQCNDVNGCPLTYVVFNRIRDLASKDRQVNDNLRFISMSFDPDHDTPKVIKAISDSLNGHMLHSESERKQHVKGVHRVEEHDISHKPVEWLYLTAESQKTLQPILQDYNQSIQSQPSEGSQGLSNFSHILRVFLIDPMSKIRNIYSVSFLHPDIIVNDVKTLLMAEKIKSNNEPIYQKQANNPTYIGPGDNKENYESKNYQTRSLSLSARKGYSVNLLNAVERPPLGLPKIPVPADNPITEDKISLGKKLFFDRRLSLNNTISCAMCHIPEQGFTNNELKTPAGFEGRSVRRNAPTLYNVGYMQKLHHDGRETSLENQVWLPLVAHNEMAMPSIGMVVKRVQSLADYQGKFEKVFSGKAASVVTIGQAIASYERTLISADSDFDRWYFGGKNSAVSESAKRGFDLFKGKAQCIVCHRVEKQHALFTDHQLHNTGIGWNSSMKKEPKVKQVQIAPGQFVSVSSAIIRSVGRKAAADLGHYEVTQNPDDRWHYRTPSLRNVSLTAPYMHDGSLSSLAEVVAFYNQGGFKNVTQSPLIRPLNLTQKETVDLVQFLKTLTGNNVESLVSDAFAVPIGDVH